MEGIDAVHLASRQCFSAKVSHSPCGASCPHSQKFILYWKRIWGGMKSTFISGSFSPSELLPLDQG